MIKCRQILKINGLMLLSLLLGMLLPFSGCVIRPKTPEYHQSVLLDRESEAFVNRVLPAVLKHWDVDVLLQNANNKLVKTTSKMDITQSFHFYNSRLGAFKEYIPASGKADIKQTAEGKKIIGRYKAWAYFERGEAEFRLTLIKEGEQWKIQLFQVDSDAFRGS